MNRFVRGFGLLAFIGALVGGAASASAESRLFTVRTDAPGVTVVRAQQNGRDLQVAGQSGGQTFFRIENPAGAVPCNNRVAFTTSTNRIFDVTADFCANNWEIVLGVATAQPAPAPAPTPAPPQVAVPAPSVPAIGQPVVIGTDDPSVTILEVFLRGQPVPINARQGRYVRIIAPTGPSGLECQRDLGLALSDGRRIARLVDICQTNFVVVVPLTGGPRPPAPPPAFLPQPSQPGPQVPGPAPQPVPLPQPVPQPQPTQPDFIDGLVWMFNADGNNASLAYAIPNSDGSEFTAVCERGSGRAIVTLNRGPQGLQPGQQIGVRLTAGDYTQTYTATASPISELDGVAHPVMQIAMTDGLWPALARESVFSIAMNNVRPYGLSLRGSAVNVRPFLAFCSQQVGPAPVPVPPGPVPVPPPPGPVPGPSANAIGFACDNGSFISVSFDQNSAVVSEGGYGPVVLFRGPPSPDGAVYIGGMSRLVGRAEQVFWSRDGGFPQACYRN